MRRYTFGWLAMFILASQIAWGEFVYDHPRRDPVRKIGIGLQGQSLINFTREEEFNLSLIWLGFSSQEIQLAGEALRCGTYDIFEVDQRFHFLDMLGGSHIDRLRRHPTPDLTGIGHGRFGYYEQYIRIQVGSKVARFVQSCGNPIKAEVDGRLILVRVQERIILKTVPGPLQIEYRDRIIPGTVEYRDRVEYSDRFVPMQADQVRRIHWDSTSELISTSQLGYLEVAFRSHPRNCPGCPQCCPPNQPPPKPGNPPPRPISSKPPTPDSGDTGPGLGPQPRR